MDNKYEIQLGVSLDTSDLKQQINQINNGKHKIDLGVNLKVNDIRDRIKAYNNNANNIKVKLGVKLDTSDIKQQIKNLNLSGLSKANGMNVAVNTESLEKSLNEVKDIISDIRTSLGSLSGDGMKDVVTSINQMATALGKAENETDSLVKSLNALSKKEFGINIDLDIGKKSNNNMIAYGRTARKQIIPELESQIKELENILGGQQAATKKLMSKGKDVGFDVFEDFNDFNSDSVIKRMEAMEKYINSMKKLAAIDNIKLDGFNEIHKDASELINDIAGVESAVDKAGDIPEKLKNIFGGSIDGDNLSKQLDSVVADLGEIRTAIQSLSSGASLDGLIQSFNRLSDVLDKLDANFDRIKNAFNGSFIDSGITQSVGKAEQKVVDVSDSVTSEIVKNEKRKQEAYKATTDTVLYHAGIVSRLNKAESNGRFYGSNRGTGYFGTGHYFVDSATKHELDNNSNYSKMPYTSVDVSHYDNLFKVTSNEIGYALHDFLRNLTRFTQGIDDYDVSELFAQFKKVFTDTTMDVAEFGSRLDQLKNFMQNSNSYDRSDSVSTQFMKSLGYGGVDTRGTSLADTRYGTVIYDLKEESVLQANITDELQKQGQMLEKINYEKGQVFDKNEDTRIQGLIDEQNKRKETLDEYSKIYDSTALDSYEAELDEINSALRKSAEAMAYYENAIENADKEAREFLNTQKALDDNSLDIEDFFFGSKKVKEYDLDENEVEKKKKELIEGYRKDIADLGTELPPLEARKQELAGIVEAERKLSHEAYKQAEQIVEQRYLEAQQAGQKIGKALGESIEQSTKQSLNLDSVIDQEVLKLMENFGISAKGKSGKSAFNDIKQAVIDYRKELSSDVSDDLNIDSEMKKIASAIADNYREVIKLDEAYEDLLMDINRVNSPKNGYKVNLIDEIKQEWGDDYRSNRAVLGSAFGTNNYGVDLASWIRDKSWSHLIDLDQSDQDIATQLLNTVKFAREYTKNPVVTGSDLLQKGYWNINDVEAEITSTLNAINNAEQQIAQSSTQSANVVVQNEERKQRAYEDTLVKQKQRVNEIDRDIDDYTNRLTDPNVSAEDGQKYMDSIDTLEQERVEILSNIEKIETALKDNENVLNSFRNSLQNIGMGSDEIDAVANRIANLGVQIETLNQKKSIRRINTEDGVVEKEVLDVDISGIDEYGNAIKLTEQYDMATADLIKSIERVSTVHQKAGTSTDKFVKQQKRAVSDLSNQARQLHSSAIDQNASRPIKETAHLDALKSKYKEIEDAIEVMGNASNEAFTEEQVKVKDLIADYKIMKNEFKNAENVSSSLKGTDFKSGLEIAKNDLEKFKANASDFPHITKTIEELDKAIASVGDKSSLDSFTDQLKVARAELAKVKAETIATNRKEKVGINVSGVTSQIANIQRISPEINEFKTVIDGAEVSVESLLNDLSRVNTAGDFSVVKARFKAFEDAAESAGIAITEVVTKASTIDKIKFKISDTGFNGFTQEVARAHADVEKLDRTYDDLTNSLKELDIAMERVYSANASGDIQALANANKEYEASLKRVTSQLKLYQQEEDRAFKNEMLDQKRTALNSDMEIWLKENTRATRDFGEEIRKLQSSLNGLDDKGLRLAGKQFTNIKKQAQAMGKTGLTVFDQLKAKAAQYASYLSAAEIFMYAEQAIRSMFEQVKLIDSAMTELKKVTDETNASYDKFLTNAATRAREIGTTIDGLVSSTADFARLGYNFVDSQGLAEVANIYAVVGDEIEGVEGATQNLISTLAAFKDEMNGMSNTDFAMSIIDSLNEVGNNFSISSGGLGEALKRSASSLAAGNNTLHESVALITAANEVTQNPDKVGNAMKTVSMRIRSAKSEMEELGEDTDGMVESTATLRAEIKALSGVDIMIDNSTFKSTYQILDEISNKWEDLSDISQATIIEKLAGKHQGNVFASLMENFSTAREVVETSLNSSGSAMQEHEKWSQSLEAVMCLGI